MKIYIVFFIKKCYNIYVERNSMEKIEEIGIGLMVFGIMFLLITVVFCIGNCLLKWVIYKLRKWEVDEDIIGYLSIFITLTLISSGMGAICLLISYWG